MTSASLATLFSLLLTTLHFGTTALAAIDFSTELQARTYSPALSISPELGYGMIIWGETTTPVYGFIRPYTGASLSPGVVEADLGLEVFPVSFLGLDIKRVLSQRFIEARDQNCEQVECLGRLESTNVSLQSYLGHAGIFLSVRWTQTFYDELKGATRPVYDYESSVLLRPARDTARFLTAAMGHEMSQTRSVGLLIQNAEFAGFSQHQEGQYLFARSRLAEYGHDNWEAAIAVGRFKSDLNVPEFSVIFSLTNTATRAVGFGR